MRECLKKELNYRTSRSSGPGGQHVNKTESRVELLWHLQKSECLDEAQKNLVYKRLHSRISDEGWLILGCEKHRSQHQNREEVTERFISLLLASLVPLKKRKATTPTRTSIEKRISNKKIRGEVKRSRRKPPED
ncbi:MAG: alternative ribosome rescue aminoacyl-tRNA hydrolase ArfB [Bacteroidota bacterium]